MAFIGAQALTRIEEVAFTHTPGRSASWAVAWVATDPLPQRGRCHTRSHENGVHWCPGPDPNRGSGIHAHSRTFSKLGSRVGSNRPTSSTGKVPHTQPR